MASKRPLRVGVVGVGYVGTLHAQTYATLKSLAHLVAVCDIVPKRAEDVARRLHCQAVTDPQELVGLVEAVSVAVPTSAHHAVAAALLKAGIHVLIEKPMTTNLKHADALLRLARRSDRVLQVGHIERFNAAIQTARSHLTHPRFIEAHRLSPYPFRGTDVSVVLDVMIHDLDLILALMRTQPIRIDALGVPVLSRSEDIANARLVFPSGCVANLTASRVSDESLRRLRIFQENCYLSVDYKQQTVELARKLGPRIHRRQMRVNRRLPLTDELRAFLHAIRIPTAARQRKAAQQAGVSGEDARKALALALAIEQAMRRPAQK